MWFSWGQHEEDNILVLVAGPRNARPLVRVQSAYYAAETCRGTDCDAARAERVAPAW